MKHYPYGILEPMKIPEIADTILDEFFQIAEQLKIRACLAYGLCLGFVRDGAYIKGDNDLDIIVVSNKKEKIKLIDALEKNGFTQGRSFSPPRNNTHFHKDRILVDIYFRELKKFYSNFDSVQYKGKTYSTPSPIEEYLSACYSNWKIKEEEATHYYDG